MFVGSVVFLKSSSMSKTLLNRDLEEVSFMSSSFILLAIMIVFLVIFSPGLKWWSEKDRLGVILNFGWSLLRKDLTYNILPKHKQAVNMTSSSRASSYLDMWRSQGSHWRNTVATQSGISWVSARRWW